MNFWLLPDPHFGHHKMKDYCSRPDGFEAQILNNVRRVVQPLDVMIVLGDFCIHNDDMWHEYFRAYCACQRWLVRGNHDRKSVSWYMGHGWDCVAEEITLKVYGKRIVFSHRPIGDGLFDLNIHGHQHNTGHHPEDKMGGKNRLLFLEHTYAPFNLKKVVGM